jgi:hypothetical protein
VYRRNVHRKNVDGRLTMGDRRASRDNTRLQAKMTRTPIIGAVLALLGFVLLPLAAMSDAAAQTSPGVTKPRIAAGEFSAQSRPRPIRPRTRILVSPTYPYRTFSTIYPVPYPVEYPGPGFVRQCSSWLAPENRVSGPVIVPRMRCWWQPGRSDLKSYP